MAKSSRREYAPRPKFANELLAMRGNIEGYVRSHTRTVESLRAELEDPTLSEAFRYSYTDELRRAEQAVERHTAALAAFEAEHGTVEALEARNAAEQAGI